MHPTPSTGYPPEFVADVLDDAIAHGSRVYGIAGLQGSGKSTLAAQMATLARERGLHVVTVSIDDSTSAGANACAWRTRCIRCSRRAGRRARTTSASPAGRSMR